MFGTFVSGMGFGSAFARTLRTVMPVARSDEGARGSYRLTFS
jgi:hypothetical protein